MLQYRTPSYRLHKPTGQAVVTLNGRDTSLGKHNTPESRAAYDRLIAEWLVNGRRRCPILRGQAAGGAPGDLTMHELMVRYVAHADAYYVKDGKPTREPDTIRQALRFVKHLYGHTAAKDCGPLALKALREVLIRHPITRTVKVRDPQTGKVVLDPETGEPNWETKVLAQGLARCHLNKQVSRIRPVVAWGVEEELVPVTVLQALHTVKGLRKAKSQAREKGPVKPVPEAHVEAVLPRVPPTVATMIRVQQLGGCRPQDVVNLRAIDIDMTGPVWEYRPPRYKTEHRNEDDNPDRERVVFPGPKVQELLEPHQKLCVTGYLFSPRRSEEKRLAQRRAERKSKLWPSHAKHQVAKRATRRKRPAADRYDVAAYRKAIRHGCLMAGVPVWFPLQLRHSAGTVIRKRYRLEASQAVLEEVMPEPKLETAALVGKGFTSDVYAWGQREVLKLFHGGDTRDRASREYAATRAVHAAGLPAPAAYELVEIEGRCGIVFERIAGMSLLEYVQATPWALFGAVRQLAELHAQIHRCEAPAGLPSLRERIGSRIEASDSPAAVKQAARDRLASLPEGTALCHGDFHPGNVLITPRGPVVIDWSSASRGDPLGDVAWTSHLVRTASLPPWTPGYVHLLLACLRSVMHRSYLRRYLRLRGGTRQQIEAWQAPIAVAARSWGGCK